VGDSAIAKYHPGPTTSGIDMTHALPSLLPL